MKINIENNNKINKSIIGSNNNNKDKEKNNIIIKIIIEIAIGLLIAFLVYKFGWNK